MKGVFRLDDCSGNLPAPVIPRVTDERLDFEIVVSHPESMDRTTLYERKATLGPGKHCDIEVQIANTEGIHHTEMRRNVSVIE